MTIKTPKLLLLFNTQKRNVYKSDKFSKKKTSSLVRKSFVERIKLILPGMSCSFKTVKYIVMRSPNGRDIDYCIQLRQGI